MRRRLRILAFSLVLGALGHAAACDSHDAPVPGLEDVVFVGNANDEALAALLATPATTDASKAAVLDAPAAGAALPASPPAAFAWHAGTTGSVWPRPAPGLDVAALLGVRTAWAHGPTTNGTAYFLVVSGPDGKALVRVFTQKTSWLPDEAAWSKLKAAAGPLSAVVTSAVFENSKLAADGGPYAGTPVSFSVQP